MNKYMKMMCTLRKMPYNSRAKKKAYRGNFLINI